tara:strand:+ start:381 stop:644 length:264 start_codon:yes stop_codon:yes gene_type:complete
MADCEVCGSYIFSSKIGCLNCNYNLSNTELASDYLEGFINSNCSDCKNKCSKDLKKKCCEKYLKKGKHCSKCPICITNIEFGDDLFV